jgi:hypothetical protein
MYQPQRIDVLLNTLFLHRYATTSGAGPNEDVSTLTKEFYAATSMDGEAPATTGDASRQSCASLTPPVVRLSSHGASPGLQLLGEPAVKFIANVGTLSNFLFPQTCGSATATSSSPALLQTGTSVDREALATTGDVTRQPCTLQNSIKQFVAQQSAHTSK